jgi:ribosome-associated protein
MIDMAALSMEFVRASGPGGQNVNKVSSAVHLRYDWWRRATRTR